MAMLLYTMPLTLRRYLVVGIGNGSVMDCYEFPLTEDWRSRGSLFRIEAIEKVLEVEMDTLHRASVYIPTLPI